MALKLSHLLILEGFQDVPKDGEVLRPITLRQAAFYLALQAGLMLVSPPTF